MVKDFIGALKIFFTRRKTKEIELWVKDGILYGKGAVIVPESITSIIFEKDDFLGYIYWVWVVLKTGEVLHMSSLTNNYSTVIFFLRDLANFNKDEYEFAMSSEAEDLITFELCLQSKHDAT